MFKLDSEISLVGNALSNLIENKLGEGWSITQQTDGLCLLDIDSNNYCVPFDVLILAMGLPKDEAIKVINRYGI